MSFRRGLLIPAVLLAFALVGCGTQPGTTAVSYERGFTGDRMVTATRSGEAVLYSGNDFNADARTSIERGEPLGFRDERGDDGEGSIIAVAGGYEQPIEHGMFLDREYFWKIQEVEDE
jgi:hypothetical protein